MALNVFFAVVTTVGVLGLSRLSTGLLPPIALAIFLSVRRYSASVSALANLGGPLFQIRYMGANPDDDALSKLIAFFVFIVFALVGLALWLAVVFARGPIERMLQLGAEYPDWFLWFVVAMAIQQLLHFSAQATLLVRRRILSYNLYKFLAGTGLFFPPFLVGSGVDAKRALQCYLIGSSVLLAGSHLFVTLWPVIRGRGLPWARLPWIASEAVRYGPLRAVVNFLDSLLFVLPAFLLRESVAEVGFLLTIFVFVQATGLVILPINELAMVATAEHVGFDDQRALRSLPETVFRLTLALSAALVAVALPFKSALFRVAVGSQEVQDGISRYAVLLVCIVPFTVYSGLKGIIEMRWRHPRNLWNLLVALGSGVVLYNACLHAGAPARVAVTVSTVVSTWTLGALTVATLRSSLNCLDRRALAATLLFALFAGVANVGLERTAVSLGFPWVAQLGVMTLSAGATAALLIRIADPNAWQLAVRALRRGRNPGSDPLEEKK